MSEDRSLAQEGAKKRVLSMKGAGGRKDGCIRMNPYYKESTPISALKDPETDRSNTVLRQAIQKKDLSYISEFLLSRNKGSMLARLPCEAKEALGELLLEFVDQPLRNEALETIREIVSNIKNVEPFIDRLKGRAIDFSKLVYVKGKIDYLRFMMDVPEEEPEVVVEG